MIDREKVETILRRRFPGAGTDQIAAAANSLMGLGEFVRDGAIVMTPEDRATDPVEDPEGTLERALIEEYFRMRGLDAQALRALPDAELKRVLTDASVYAATKLAEVESRAHFVHEIHRKE